MVEIKEIIYNNSQYKSRNKEDDLCVTIIVKASIWFWSEFKYEDLDSNTYGIDAVAWPINIPYIKKRISSGLTYEDIDYNVEDSDVMASLMARINNLGIRYSDTKDKKLLERIHKLIPLGFMCEGEINLCLYGLLPLYLKNKETDPSISRVISSITKKIFSEKIR